MNIDGSCAAVYLSQSYSNILEVIKQLQALGYSECQFSVIGRRVNVSGDKSRFLGLLKSFRHKKLDKHFWGNLKDLLKGEIYFQTSSVDYIAVMGELSHVNLEKNLIQNKQDPYTKISGLLYFAGIPKVSFEYYETIIKKGQLLLIIHGNYQELKRAGSLLDLSGNINVSLHLANTS